MELYKYFDTEKGTATHSRSLLSIQNILPKTLGLIKVPAIKATATITIVQEKHFYGRKKMWCEYYFLDEFVHPDTDVYSVCTHKTHITNQFVPQLTTSCGNSAPRQDQRTKGWCYCTAYLSIYTAAIFTMGWFGWSLRNQGNGKGWGLALYYTCMLVSHYFVLENSFHVLKRNCDPYRLNIYESVRTWLNDRQEFAPRQHIS